jgi:hypothetical protein
MQNYFMSTLKNLQNTSCLNIPKSLFISGPSHLAHAKKKEKHQIKAGWCQGIWQNHKNLTVFQKVNNQKKDLKSFKKH